MQTKQGNRPSCLDQEGKDTQGKIYNSEIDEILFRGSSVLTAVWKAIQFTLSMQDPKGNLLRTETAAFGEEHALPQSITKDGVIYAGWTIQKTKIMASGPITSWQIIESC